MIIERCTRDSLEDWIKLRQALWPHGNEREHRSEAADLLARKGEAVAFLALDDASTAVAFAEATLRRDYVNGCATSPVGFLEGHLRASRLAKARRGPPLMPCRGGLGRGSWLYGICL